MRWLLDSSDKPRPPSGSEPIDRLDKRIVFDDVTLKYPASGSRAVVLHSASFEIRGGCSTAIGRSGAGTTTVVNLLIDGVCRLTGSTLLNGGARSPWLARTWNSWTVPYSRISPTAKVPRLLKSSARRGSPSAWLHRKAARRLPDRRRLSGREPVGRAAPARRACQGARRDPAILILDEATNAVDGLSEAAIVETLKLRAGRRMTNVIGHHRSTISFCDDVVVLSDGRVKSSASPTSRRSAWTSSTSMKDVC